MKKLLVMLLLVSMTAVVMADVVLTTPVTVTTTTPTTTITTNTITVTNAKIVWTDFSIRYMPPHYSNATYIVSYMLQNLDTKREIPQSRKTVFLTEKQVVDFAASKGIEFSSFGTGIGSLLNEYLKTVFATTTSPVK